MSKRRLAPGAEGPEGSHEDRGEEQEVEVPDGDSELMADGEGEGGGDGGEGFESSSFPLAQRSYEASSSSSSSKRRVRFDPSSFAADDNELEEEDNEGTGYSMAVGRDDDQDQDEADIEQEQEQEQETGEEDEDEVYNRHDFRASTGSSSFDEDPDGMTMTVSTDDGDRAPSADSSQLPNDNDYAAVEPDRLAQAEATFLASFNKSAGASLAAALPDTVGTRHAILAALGKKVKKPCSSWILYTNSARELLPPSLSFKEKAKLMAEDFHKLTTAEKTKLDAQAASLRDSYLDTVASLYGELSEEEVATGRAGIKAGGPGSGKGGANAVAAMAISMSAKLHLLGSNPSLALPLSRIRKIAKMDPDCRNLAKDGAVAVTKAVEFFVGFLAVHCVRTAGLRGAKSIKLADVEHTIHSNRTLSAFLAEDFPRLNGKSDDYLAAGKGAGAKAKAKAAAAAAAGSGTGSSGAGGGGGEAQRKLQAAAVGSGKVTSFFSGAAKPAAAAQEGVAV